MHFLQILSVWQNWLIFKADTIIINHQLELKGTRVKYLDHEKRDTNMRFGLIAYPKKPLISLACPERLDV